MAPAACEVGRGYKQWQNAADFDRFRSSSQAIEFAALMELEKRVETKHSGATVNDPKSPQIKNASAPRTGVE